MRICLLEMDHLEFFILIFLLKILNISAVLNVTPIEPRCQNFNKMGKYRCCIGFRTIGGKCYPCVGSFWLECSKPCPEGYFGIQCTEKCSCDKCNATSGECYGETTEIETLDKAEDSRPTVDYLPLLLGGVIGGLVLIIACFLLWRRFRSRRSLNYVDTMALPHIYDQPICDSVPSSYVTLEDELSKNDPLVKKSDYLEII